jgi:hypothetical protein
MEGREGEFVVVNVDDEAGRVELLQLKPGHIERNIPITSIKRHAGRGPDALPRSND